VRERERRQERDIKNILGSNTAVFFGFHTYVRSGGKYFHTCSSSV